MISIDRTNLQKLFLAKDIGSSLSFNTTLASIARWRIGGPADVFVEPANTGEVAQIVRQANRFSIPTFIVGEASNTLFDSRGFRGIVVKIGANLSSFSISGDTVRCGAGTWVPHLAARLARRGLRGLEHIAGIPGNLGGLVIMNGGSQQKGIGSRVISVTCVNKDGEIVELGPKALSFSYRKSSLQFGELIVTSVVLAMERDSPSSIRKEMLEVLSSRRKKFPIKLPNCGSTFLSDPSMYRTIGPPGKAIEQAGLKGCSIGDAMVSCAHANFIVNKGAAKSDEVLALIALIRKTVEQKTGYRMNCEVRHITQDGEEGPAHIFTDRQLFDSTLLATAQYPHA